MKKVLLLLAMFAGSTVLLQAQDNWIDVNFTRDSTMWKETMPVMAVVATYNYQCIPDVTNTYLGYKFDGAFGRFGVNGYSYTPINADNPLQKLIYAFRLASTSTTTNMTFPEVQNVGKIRVNFLCGNATAAAEFTLQKYISGEGVDEVWADFDPVIKFNAPAHAFSTTSFTDEKEVNIVGPVKLRFKGPAVKNLHIFAVTFTKGTTGLNEAKMNNIKIQLANRKLQIDNAGEDFKATIYNLTGVQLGNIKRGEFFNIQAVGSYLVRIQTADRIITKKIVAF